MDTLVSVIRKSVRNSGNSGILRKLVEQKAKNAEKDLPRKTTVRKMKV